MGLLLSAKAEAVEQSFEYTVCRTPSWRMIISQDGECIGQVAVSEMKTGDSSSMVCPFCLLRHLSLKIIPIKSAIVINCIRSPLLLNMMVGIQNTAPILKLKTMLGVNYISPNFRTLIKERNVLYV